MGEDTPQVTIATLAALDPAALRECIPDWLGEHVSAVAEERRRSVEAVRALLAACSDDELLAARREYAALGSEYRYYPAAALLRPVGRAYLDALIATPRIEGIAHLRAALAAGPTLLVSNHVSYADSQVTDLLLWRGGAPDIADRLVFVAGPKVYENPFRRMAAICLNTLQTAQSTRLDQNTAALSPREVVRIARATVRRAGEMMATGAPVLLYAEGTRTRSGRLGSFLKATSRYAGGPETRIVPVAISGSGRFLPIHDKRLYPTPLALAISEAIPVREPGPESALAAAWERIAALLPEAMRPPAGTPALR